MDPPASEVAPVREAESFRVTPIFPESGVVLVVSVPPTEIDGEAKTTTDIE